MKLQKIINSIAYTNDIELYLKSLMPHSQKQWNIGSKPMKKFKKLILDNLKICQNGFCAYCGFPLEVSSNIEIEHIAPKADKLYPQFMFEKYNLVLSCHLCNYRGNKGEVDTIDILDIDYDKCAFNIVHPYFDDPDIHYEYLPSTGSNAHKIIIQAITPEATHSIEILDLNSEARTTARAEQAIMDELKRKLTSKQINILLSKSLEYK